MQIIGENISSSEDFINTIIEERDVSSLLEQVKNQINWGSTDMIAINCATRLETEPSDIVWITETIQRNFPISLCFDSGNPEAQRAGLSVHVHGRAMVNSITGEEESMRNMLPLVQKYHAKVTALLHDETGMPNTVEDRLRVIPSIVSQCKNYLISPEDIYLDCMVFPLATGDSNTQIYLDTLSVIRQNYPEYKTICGLNNISYGLPVEDLLNIGFLTMCALQGQHAVYAALTPNIAASAYTIEALLGNDPFLSTYIQAYREQKLEVFS